jgi:2-succinyl-5-enolpyruvyl-6-hydroxy-3-cyclohexene-1-carboxylate synthase
MISTTKSGVRIFTEIMVQQGVRHVVCSPGSRNAPLVIAFDNHPDIKTYVVHDERSAAFFALGMAQALNEPVAVACTSGSALANYYPAVAEAYYQCIPLVVLSADRPQHLINQGDGQTIMQANLFGSHVHAYYSVDEDPKDIDLVKSGITAVLEQCNGPWKGPVHFNFPLEEPLYLTDEFGFEPFSAHKNETQKVAIDLDEDLISKWNDASKKMILVGQLPVDNRLSTILADISADPSVAILCETTSNIYHQRFNQCIDRSLTAIQRDKQSDFAPDLLITIGGAVVSKRIKQFLRDNKPMEYWRIGYDFPEMDTYFCKTKQLGMESETFLKMLKENSADMPRSNFGSRWKQIDYTNQEKLNTYKKTAHFSDFIATDIVLDSIPDPAYVHLANSTPIRYAQLFDGVKGLNYLSNRGTSGIDGSSSTAVGFSMIKKDELNVLITGDVSFFYDSNALWNAYLGSNLKIVLINNSGGGIFRIIDGPAQSQQLETYFEAFHSHSAEYICKAFGLNYYSAASAEETEQRVIELLSDHSAPGLLEIITPREVNALVLNEFFNLLKK